jgi:DnaJ like chaperone protein
MKIMNQKIRGKVVGGLLGLAFGGPMGAILGLVIGHAHDKRPDEVPDARFTGAGNAAAGDLKGTAQQNAFYIGIIVLGAKMAKADGRVKREEIEAFKRVFRVPESQVAVVGRVFDQARLSADGFEPYAMQLAAMFRGKPAVLEEVLSGLFIIAAADSSGLSPAERRFLERVAVIFGFNSMDFTRIAARSGVNLGGAKEKEKPRDQSYAILGLKEAASVIEIKTAYRALIRKHHPDRLVAQGMAPEFIATATEKMKRINGAYDEICKTRGIK